MKTGSGKWLWLLLAGAGFLCACSNHKSSAIARCSTENPCPALLTCIEDEGFCRQPCTVTTDCADGTTCSTDKIQDYCVTSCQGPEDCADYEQCSSTGVCELV